MLCIAHTHRELPPNTILSMGGRSPLVAILLISLAAAVVSPELIGISHGSTTTFCRGSERKALMEFKNGLHDPSNRLLSWVGDDCCAWEGVGCGNVTGHVVKVDLRNKRRLYLTDDCDDDYLYQWSPDAIGCKSALHGDITPSLLSLVHLKSLDLSGNYLDHNRVPKFLGSFSRLTYLRLSGAGFLGRIPDELGNISTLHRLDLSYNYHQNGYGLSSQQTLYLENPGWLSRLTSLRHLNMNWVSFRNAPNWLQALNALPHIQEIELINCHLGTFPPSLPHVNFTSLTTLDLSYNFINSSIPDWLFNITSLEYLYLSWNELNWLSPASIARFTSLRALDLSGNAFPNGFVSAALSNLCNLQILILRGVPINDVLANLEVVFSGCLMFSLEELDLCDAQLSGSLPDWLGNLKNLKHLDLSSNFLYGSVPASLGSLSLLQHLDVNSNNLNGTIAEGIGQMKGLVLLDLGNNSLSLSEVHLANLSSLKSLDISHNSLVLKESNDWIPPFQLQTLYMAFCQIGPKPHFPKWLRTQRTLYDLDLTHAGIQGMIPKWLPSSLEDLVLSNNKITGHVPQYLSNLTYLNLRNNSFSGHLPPRITIAMPNIYMLDLSMNNLSGSIPLSFCQIKFWEILLLFKNNLSGKLPDCWKDSSHLAFLDLSSNRLEGGIPNSTCNLQSLQSLHLSHNYLSGQISLSLKGCTKLVTLDLSHNNFTGKIPTWIGENLLRIKVLDLRSNVFTGSIPEFSLLSSLQILDLSNNNLSGTIPRSFGNFSAMKPPLQVPNYIDGWTEDMWLFMKGGEFEYNNLLSYVRIIDLSNNGLSGYIPEELGNLHILHSLNISGNCLTGEIPRNIGGMQSLEVLDLSRNYLSGAIPSSLAALNFLSHLNLSYNYLSGRIPTGNQLQTFDSSVYAGNPNLCGPPLVKICIDDDMTKDNEGEQNEDTENRNETIWLYTSIALGYIVGFWTICGTLLLRRRWRMSYFCAIDNMFDTLHLMMEVNMTKFRRERWW